MAKVEPDNPDGETRQAAGGRRKLLLVLAVAAPVLLLGAGAAYFLLGDADRADGEDAGGDAAAQAQTAGEPTYHKLDPVFVVNLAPGGRAKMLQVGLQVYTRDPSLVELLERHDPMLRHHLFDVLAAQQADELYARAGRERLQRALEDELRRQLEEAGVSGPRIEAVYFTQFVLQ